MAVRVRGYRRSGIEPIPGVRDVHEERAPERSAGVVVRHLPGVQGGEPGWLPHEAKVGVPVVAGVRAADVAAAFPDVRVEVNLRISRQRVFLPHVHLERSEPLTERNLYLRRQILVPEHGDAGMVERVIHLLERRLVERVREVEVSRFDSEGMQGRELRRCVFHLGYLPIPGLEQSAVSGLCQPSYVMLGDPVIGTAGVVGLRDYPEERHLKHGASEAAPPTDETEPKSRRCSRAPGGAGPTAASYLPVNQIAAQIRPSRENRRRQRETGVHKSRLRLEGPNVNLDSLDPLFGPRTIAVIGASTDPAKISGRPVRYLKEHFRGAICPVNTRVQEVQEVQGLKAVAAVEDLPEHVDQAIVCLPSRVVVPTLEACAAHGIGSAVVFSAGFAEIGDEGRRMQERIRDLARETGMRVLGPNCMGIMNLAHDEDGEEGALGQAISTFTIAIEVNAPRAGPVGIVSQSGAFAAHAYTLAVQRGLGLSCWVTTGNECDVEFADSLAYLANDPATRIIMGYMEGCGDREKLFDALDLARANRKPVVMVKVGSSGVGRRAAASHTAVLTGGDEVFDAVFRQYGVHRAGTLDEFFDVAYACSFGRYPGDRSIGIASISGGVGILMADRAVSHGLDVAPMPESGVNRMWSLLPYAAVANPVDMTARIISQPELVKKTSKSCWTKGATVRSPSF